jgi:uncharacterized OB-fold protein
MASPALDIPEPEINPESEPYWLAANQGVLLLGKCARCGEFHHYPRRMCPLCNSLDVSWVPAGGYGTIYSFSPLWRTETPYTLAWIVLDEQVGMMTNIIDCDPRVLAVGQRVKIVFPELSSGQKVPMAALGPGESPATGGDRP